MLQGTAGDGSMKVSETRDSSLQVLPTAGMVGPNSNFAPLQTNFNNMNTGGGEFDDVSRCYLSKIWYNHFHFLFQIHPFNRTNHSCYSYLY